MVTYAPDEVGLADKSPCAGIRADLKICLLASDCCKRIVKYLRNVQVRKQYQVNIKNCSRKRKLPESASKRVIFPEECIQLRQSFFECKRSLLDNRRRFRGHKGY
ncbi:hypothetical protein HF086_014691 [Spodoptera exigua]|uniref:Cytochrome c oxidase assembly factor 5 n=1 Tax=Spodoptera exigua TaxID=7107 RepID=A0A922M7J3_SPOEX|nr:hypothetical protein HF086_014691 [Spodoptera exigua]